MRGALFSAPAGIPERSIFRQEEALYSDFLPDILPHREGQAQALAAMIRPLTEGRAPENAFIWGAAGVGKTSVAKFIARELKEHTDILPVYVNCWQNDTRHAVLTTISYALGSFAPRRGTATDEIFERVVEGMRKRGRKGLVIILDEIDKLMFNDGGKLIYDLTRGAVFSGKIALVMISNDQFVMRKLDERARSSLSYQEVHYPAYRFDELKDIFAERLRAAFAEGGTKPGMAGVIARFVETSGGDVRLGLEALLKAGRLADDAGKPLGAEHIQKSLEKLQNTKLKAIVAGLSEKQLPIARILADGKERTSGALLKEYCKLAGETNERTFRNYVSELESKGLIITRISGKGQRGKTRIVSLRSPEMMRRNLEEIDRK